MGLQVTGKDCRRCRLPQAQSVVLPFTALVCYSRRAEPVVRVSYALQVTQGLVDWTDTIQTILTRANVAIDGITPQFANSTVQEVLAHRAG